MRKSELDFFPIGNCEDLQMITIINDEAHFFLELVVLAIYWMGAVDKKR